MFEQHPILLQWMILPETFAASSLPSVLKWLHHFGSAVQGVSCKSSVAAEAVLTPLTWLGSHIHTIHVHSPSPSMLHVLSVMTSLTTCDLLNDCSSPCDLTPMQALPTLNSLYLQDGIFLNIHTLAHLTELRLSNVDVQTNAAWACCISLKQAHWYASYVGGLHPEGLLACSSLQNVSMVNVVITGIDLPYSERLCLFSKSPRIPKSMSRLTDLTHLQLGMDGPRGAELQVSQLYQLISLTHFSFTGSSALNLELGLSQLTNLVCLSLSSNLRGSLLHIGFAALDWQKLYSLQMLILRECKLSFDASILTIVEHQCMQTIIFDGCIPADQHTSKFYADLVYTLALRRPDIRFSTAMIDI